MSIDKKSQSKTAGLVFPGCAALGVGIGLLLDAPGAGALIGVGAGFLALFYLSTKE
jgi:hypothetical protein